MLDERGRLGTLLPTISERSIPGNPRSDRSTIGSLRGPRTPPRSFSVLLVHGFIAECLSARADAYSVEFVLCETRQLSAREIVPWTVVISSLVNLPASLSGLLIFTIALDRPCGLDNRIVALGDHSLRAACCGISLTAFGARGVRARRRPIRGNNQSGMSRSLLKLAMQASLAEQAMRPA